MEKQFTIFEIRSISVKDQWDNENISVGQLIDQSSYKSKAECEALIEEWLQDGSRNNHKSFTILETYQKG